jgi:tetratricopeptide (TPR) repeat protein
VGAPEVAEQIEEADHLTDDERYDEAIALLDRVLADKKLTKKWRIQALMARASILDDAGDVQRALADCAAALKLAPKSPDILYLRAVIHQSAEDWSASRADCDAAIAAKPARSTASPELYELRGLACYNLGDYKGARADFAKAIAANPDIEARFHVYRGMAALLLDEPKAAIADFTNALANDDTNVKALAQRAKAYEACGEPAQALADLDRLREMLPPSPLLETERARVSALASRRTRSSRSRAPASPRSRRTRRSE